MSSCTTANRKPSAAKPVPKRISRDNQDDPACRITLKVLVTSCMWNIDTANPKTIAGPIASNAGSATWSMALAEKRNDPSVWTTPSTRKAPTHIWAITVNKIMGSSATFMVRSPGGWL